MIDAYSSQVTYKEPLLLFRNDGGRLKDVSASGGPAFAQRYPSRGLAVGDFDNDGRPDVLVSNNGEAPLLLRNVHESRHHWLGLTLQGAACNRDAIGAKITWSFGGQKRSRLKTAGGSYLSSHDPREILGIGTAERIDWVEIAWPQPSGRVERFTNLPIDRYVRIVEGKGSIDA
jgi:enediyne biosynthesis protein E4